MIKSNELRCGNLVGRKYWNPHPTEPSWMIEVETVVEIRMAKVLLEDRHKQRCKMNYESIEPIPLTEDWLERFGFENWDKNAWQKKNIIGIRKHGEGWLYLSGSLHVNLFYVHQLQNLYFALTQTELTPSDGGKIE